MKQALIFANGDDHSGAMVQRALDDAPDAFVIAADGGARIAQMFQLVPDIVIGDLDSLSSDEQADLQAQGIPLQQFPPEKNETDLELALQYAQDHQYDWIRIIGGIGGRVDQTLANMYLLALPGLQSVDVRIVAGKQEIYALYPGTHTIRGEEGDTISLIPFGGDARGIQTHNLYYPLNDESLLFGPARGVSNVLAASEATITLQDGILLLVHSIGRA